MALSIFRKLRFAVIATAAAGLLTAPLHALGAGPELINPDQLNVGLKQFVLLDGRPVDEWKKSHIPGAGSFSWEVNTMVDSKGVRFRTVSPEKLAASLSKIGISEKTPVVVYGDADTSWGGEGWICWVLTWLGHKGDILLLEGGFQAWVSRGYPVSSSVFSPKRAEYHPEVNTMFSIDTDELETLSGAVQIVDTRSLFERLQGKIPGSVHISWKSFYKGKDSQPLNRKELINLLRKKGIDPDKPVIYYCTGGIRSAYAWTVHQLNGLSDARNYEGGMEAWERR